MKPKLIITAVIFLLLLFFTYLMLKLSWPYASGRYDVDFLLTKQGIIHIRHWRYAFYIHVALSTLVLLAGFTQFSNIILRRFKKIHRVMGYIYAITVLFFAGPSGLIMGFYANGTWAAKTSFVMLALLWMTFTARAVFLAKRKKIAAHRQWMIRSYALTLSAITLRIYAWALPQLVHINGVSEYTLIAWLSWTVNLIVAEIIIKARPASVLA